jgi:signal peptidase I
MNNKNMGSVADTAVTVVIAILIALVVRTIAYEPFNIPSGSMKPTLLVGDYLFISKASYGYSRHSLPFSMPLISDRLFFEKPERGDVAVFKLPTDNKTDYIKRLIGLPGDRIQVEEGILHINGQAVTRERVEDFIEQDKNGNTRRTPRYLETLPNGRSHYILESKGDYGPSDNTGLYVIPEGYYFAMGDNRDNSRDSRFLDLVGFIPRENLVGRAEILFFSINGSAWKIWEWLETIRFERLLESIE